MSGSAGWRAVCAGAVGSRSEDEGLRAACPTGVNGLQAGGGPARSATWPRTGSPAPRAGCGALGAGGSGARFRGQGGEQGCGLVGLKGGETGRDLLKKEGFSLVSFNLSVF